MIFGIDLGTTNSLIGAGDTMYSGLVSSNVDMASRKEVPRDYLSEDVVASYKTDMSMGADGKLPIEASAIVLEELARQASRRYGEDVKDVVISVPAYFSTSQREAVYEAAKKANLNLKCLINEPTAAAIYVCRDVKDIVVVYDLGGGTFDVSIVDSRLGSYNVVATDGQVLGGDDLDRAIVQAAVKECKVPIRFRTKHNLEKLRFAMRLAKEEIQRTHSDVFVDLSEYGATTDYVLTEEKYKELVEQVFGSTVERTSYLICKYIPAKEHAKIIFVGGSSACPYLKEMLRERLQVDNIYLEEIESDVNPDVIVAKGVAMYAGMLETGEASTMVEDITKRLCIESADGGSITIIDANTIVPCTASATLFNEKKSNKLSLKLYQGDSLFAKNNDYIGTLVYDYGRDVEAGEGVVEVTVSVSADGVISLSASEVLFYGAAQEIKLTAR